MLAFLRLVCMHALLICYIKRWKKERKRERIVHNSSGLNRYGCKQGGAIQIARKPALIILLVSRFLRRYRLPTTVITDRITINPHLLHQK